MKSYFATYRISASAANIESTVLVFTTSLNIGFRDETGKNEMVNWMLKDVKASFEVPLQQSRIRHLSGSELLIDGNDAAGYINLQQSEQKKPWYNKSSGSEWIRNSVLLVLILAALFGVYLLIVPWLSQQFASKVSIKTERQLGDAVYNALGLDSQVDSTKTRIVKEFFDTMDIPTPYEIRISVVKDDVTNAFALPGGRIVVYTALLNKIETYPELAALLSHEFTHVNNRHSTKSIFRRLGSKVFIGLLFGKFGTVTSVLVNQADNIRSLKYSRRLEKEADLNGLSILMKRSIDPDGFDQLFDHLAENLPQDKMPEILASHPDVKKRMKYIDDAAKDAIVAVDEQLKIIFDKLNSY